MNESGNELASWWIRALAAILDMIPAMILGIALLLWVFTAGILVAFGEDPDYGDGIGLILIAALILIVGYIVWWLIALGRAQTPGKQIVGIRVVNADTGQPPNWGMMFLREFVIKGLLAGAISGITSGIGGVAILINYLWPLWDDKNQTIHDKMVNSQVVRSR